MVDSQLGGEGVSEMRLEGMKVENIDVLRNMIKEHDQQAKTKMTPRKLFYDESKEEYSDSSGKSQRSLSRSRALSHLRRFERLENQSKSKEKPRGERSRPRGKRLELRVDGSNTKGEGESEDSGEDLSMPYKRPKPTPFTTRITHLEHHEKAKLPRNIKVYEDPKSMDIFKELSQKFLEEFSQQKRYAKDPTEIQELAKKLNDKIYKMVDEIFERVRVFIRGEAVVGSAEVARTPQWDKGVTRPVWSEAVALRKLTHLVKDIRRGNQKNGSQGRWGMKVINMVSSRVSRKRPYDRERTKLTEEIAFLAIPQNSLTDAPIILEGTIEGYHVNVRSS
ncbi:hypothetical protein Tco_1304860 [Tanacetum coccineum]